MLGGGGVGVGFSLLRALAADHLLSRMYVLPPHELRDLLLARESSEGSERERERERGHGTQTKGQNSMGQNVYVFK